MLTITLCKTKQNKQNKNKEILLQNSGLRISCCLWDGMGSIPCLVHWVKDLALLQQFGISHCCNLDSIPGLGTFTTTTTTTNNQNFKIRWRYEEASKEVVFFYFYFFLQRNLPDLIVPEQYLVLISWEFCLSLPDYKIRKRKKKKKKE